MTKRCSKCKVFKGLNEFYKDKNQKYGVFMYCKVCDDARRKVYQGKNPNYAIEKHLRQRFGMSIAKRQEMIDNQRGMCKICQTTDPGSRGWQIDHDHSCCPGRQKTCGKCIRGLICISCNKGLGDFKDNPDILRKAIQYLESYARKSEEKAA